MDQVPPRVFSTEFKRIVDNVPSTSTDENVTQNNSEFENLESTLREEITEEIKTLVAQSQNAIIRAFRPANRDDTEMMNSDPEITPVRTRSSPNKTLRFNNVENLEPSCSRNLVTGVPNGPTHPKKKTKGAHKANLQPRNVQTSPKHYSAHQAKWTPTMHSPSPRNVQRSFSKQPQNVFPPQ